MNTLKLFVICAMLFSRVLFAAEPKNLDELKVPPRTIDDILKVIQQSKGFEVQLAESRSWIEREAPLSASPEALNKFYVNRAEAYARLGQMEKAIHDMELVISKYPSGSNILRTQDLMVLSGFEAQVGNLHKAIQLALKARENIRPSEMGMLTGNNNGLVMLYSEVGDFQEAERYLRDAEAVLVALRRTNVFNTLGEWWTAQLLQTRSVYLSQQGKWVDAEINLRRCVQMMSKWLNYVETLPINQSGADWSSDPTATAYLLRSVAPKRLNVQILLARSLAMQGKLVEAESQIREVIELTLRYYGKNSTQAGAAILELSSIISEQNRFAEAGLLSKTAVDIFAASGAAPGSLGMMKAKKSLAKNLVAARRYEEADKIF